MADDDQRRKPTRTPVYGVPRVGEDPYRDVLLRDLHEAIEELHGLSSELREDIVDIKGKGGDNGKLGEVRRQVDGVRAWLRWALMGAAGSLLTSGVLIFRTGLQVGRAENRIEVLESRYNELRQARRWRDSPTDQAKESIP